MARIASLVAHALGALSIACVTSCIFLIDPVDVQENCSFTGTTACAACIRKSCQRAVNGCCESILCRGISNDSAVLAGVDACGSGDRARCATSVNSSSSSFDSSANAVNACIKASCLADCT